jgi:hypothetical protein
MVEQKDSTQFKLVVGESLFDLFQTYKPLKSANMPKNAIVNYSFNSLDKSDRWSFVTDFVDNFCNSEEIAKKFDLHYHPKSKKQSKNGT